MIVFTIWNNMLLDTLSMRSSQGRTSQELRLRPGGDYCCKTNMADKWRFLDAALKCTQAFPFVWIIFNIFQLSSMFAFVQTHKLAGLGTIVWQIREQESGPQRKKLSGRPLVALRKVFQGRPWMRQRRCTNGWDSNSDAAAVPKPHYVYRPQMGQTVKVVDRVGITHR